MERIALIPAYQPDGRMTELLAALRAAGFACVVVDDGSGPAYGNAFRRAEAYAAVLSHPENRGKGAALKTGMAYIAENWTPPFVAVTVDADGQHRPEDAIQVAEAAEARPGTLVLGSRRMDRSAPLRSRMGNAVTRGIFRLSSGAAVYDTQTGLRAFTDELLEPLAAIPGSRYEYEMNVLMTCARQGVPMEETPIQTVYLGENESTHFRTVADAARIFGEILKFSASSLASFLMDYGLFCLLGALGLSAAAANVGARAVSATVNYTLNKRLVFRRRGSPLRSAGGYFLLAAGLLALNTLLLTGLTGLGMSRYRAKLLVEAGLFLVSYAVQRLIIFRKRDET